MADTTMNVKVLNVTKTTAQWAANDVKDTIISKGLLCIELDSNNKSWAKVGDGVHKYAELPYITDAAIASLGNLFKIKGVVASTSELPSTGNHPGDVYFVGSASTSGSDKFEEYVWTTGGTWEFIGKVTDPVIPTYTGGTGITIDSNDAINLDIASANSLGGIKVGTNLSIANDGTLSATDTTYSVATGSADGLMSSADFTKLAGIEVNANNYSLPAAASDTLGGIKVGTNLSIDGSGVLSATDTTYTFDGTYDASTNKAATVSTVTDAIGALDVPSTGTGAITGFGAGKTLATLTETDGKISATFQDISIANTQVTGLGAAAVKGVTDNSSATAVTSGDTNLITGRTLYYAGYAKDSDVVKGITVNGTAATVTSGTAAITGVATGLSYTNTSGTTSTITPTNGNLDLTSLTLNCTL